MQVGDQGTGVATVIDDLGFESPLKDMADPVVAFVVTDGEGCEEPCHGLAKVASGGGEKQVIVVGHDDVGTELQMEGMTGLANCFEELGMLVIGGKNNPPFICPSHDVVVRPWILDPWLSWHRLMLGSDPNIKKVINLYHN